MPALPILSKTNRSFRKFKGNYPLSEEYAKKFIDYARTAASARNLQPLKYHIVIDKEEREKVFPLLSWAGYISDWNGPAEGQRPTGYIIMCNDTTLCPNTTNALIDAGIAA
ncbi:MAG: nitroreductase family protein, partial [Anaerotardibacter sp.]